MHIKINSTAKQPEINAAQILEYCVFKDAALVVGDQSELKLPDIYTEDLLIGIEVVQMEKAEDLDTKYIWNEIKKNNGNFALTKKFCDENYPNKYHLEEYNGKVFCFMTKGGSHSIDWMKPIYDREINKKLKKLNNGNYSGIKREIDLCISIVYRAKRLYDAKLITYSYKQIAKNYKDSYDKLYIIESDKIFIVYPNRIQNINPIYYHNCICDFEIKGENFIEEISDILYSKITQL